MKVLFVTNMYPVKKINYYGIHVKEQIDCLNNLFKLNSKVFFINAFEKGKLQYLLSIIRLPRIIKNGNFDIIHIHYGISGLFLLFSKPAKAKVYMTLHGGDILKRQGNILQVLLTKLVLRKVAKVFIQNEEMGIVVKGLNIPYEIIPCGVDINLFKPNEKIEKNSKDKLILFPGDPNRHVKNFPLFQEVIEILKEKAEFNYCYKSIHNLSRIDVCELMNRADCLLLTSFSEGSPQVIKEALSCNLPIVSVNVGDVKHVTSEIDGCYVSERSEANELALLIVDALKNKSVEIRKGFLAKGEYDSLSISKKIFKNYTS